MNEIYSILHSPLPWVIGAIFLVIAAWNLKKILLLQELSKHFKGSLTWYCAFIPSFQGEMNGFRFSVQITNKTEFTPGLLQINIFKNSFYKLKIIRNDSIAAQTIFKAMGLVKISTNDPDFDEEFSTFANNADFVRNYINSNKKIQIIDLLDQGFYLFSIDRTMSSLIKNNPTIKDLNPEFLKDVIKKFRETF